MVIIYYSCVDETEQNCQRFIEGISADYYTDAKTGLALFKDCYEKFCSSESLSEPEDEQQDSRNLLNNMMGVLVRIGGYLLLFNTGLCSLWS